MRECPTQASQVFVLGRRCHRRLALRHGGAAAAHAAGGGRGCRPLHHHRHPRRRHRRGVLPRGRRARRGDGHVATLQTRRRSHALAQWCARGAGESRALRRAPRLAGLRRGAGGHCPLRGLLGARRREALSAQERRRRWRLRRPAHPLLAAASAARGADARQRLRAGRGRWLGRLGGAAGHAPRRRGGGVRRPDHDRLLLARGRPQQHRHLGRCSCCPGIAPRCRAGVAAASGRVLRLAVAASRPQGALRSRPLRHPPLRRRRRGGGRGGGLREAGGRGGRGARQPAARGSCLALGPLHGCRRQRPH
mmetsp:Transcript_92464/g.235042  ORF Transcript_92464/g.235042 Transcript_92464/m.235042 type:complete len:307 (-) Transcript_92464:90-1010(-)